MGVASSQFVLLTLCLLGGNVLFLVLGNLCTQYDGNMGATFDLTDLVRSHDESSYAVEDGDIPCTPFIEKNYTYMFNVCGPVTLGVPNSCRGKEGVNAAGALQIDKNRLINDPTDDYCYVVGEFSGTSQLQLLDMNDPTKGVSLTYYGDYCKNPVEQRRFVIELVCADKLNPSPSHVYEVHHCTYTATIPSVYGCPLECPVSDRHLCGGNGHCHYDHDLGSSRCYCNKGYLGKDCMETDNELNHSSYSTTLLGLIVTLFSIVLLLIVSIALMIKQIAAYKDDLTNYEVLAASGEGDISQNNSL